MELVQFRKLTTSCTVGKFKLKSSAAITFDYFLVISYLLNLFLPIFSAIRDSRRGWIYSYFMAMNMQVIPSRWISFVSSLCDSWAKYWSMRETLLKNDYSDIL